MNCVKLISALHFNFEVVNKNRLALRESVFMCRRRDLNPHERKLTTP